MRVAINLLTEDPEHPSGAHWFWTRVIPEMAKRLEPGEELHLLVSPKSRHLHQGYGPNVPYITYPWSNERRKLRTLSEHLYSPLRLPLSRIDVFNTLMAPVVNPSWSLVMHMKTMHAFTAPESVTPLTRAYRRMNYPRSARARRRHHHQLREPALGDRALPGGGPGQAQADLRGGRPRPVQAGRRRRGPGAGRDVRRDQAVRAVRVLAVAVQELRRAAAGLGAGPRRARRPPAGDRRRRAGREVRRLAARAGRRARHRRRRGLRRRQSRSRRPSASTGRRTRSCTRRSTRPSGCPSSRPWRAAARS